MGQPAAAFPVYPRTEGTWLRNRKWDLTWVSLSVILVALPYSIYLLMTNLNIEPLAASLGTTGNDLVRNTVNAFVALLVGGPHMYATYTRTVLDHHFARQHKRLLFSSLIVPVTVVTMALVNLTLLLTLFFFWASIHVLHQIIFIIDLYHKKQRKAIPLALRLSDYAVVVTSLYPLAAWKISTGNFLIGSNNLSQQIAAILPIPLGPWMIWLAGTAFGLSLLIWLAKTYYEIRIGQLHVAKTLFITLTIVVAFFIPILGNLDTAFQGMNIWHSFQYLALIWMLNSLQAERGQLSDSPMAQRLLPARRYYFFNFALTIGDILLGVVIFLVLTKAVGMPFDAAFDRAYYIAVLSFLLMHYFQDHYIFSHAGVMMGQA